MPMRLMMPMIVLAAGLAASPAWAAPADAPADVPAQVAAIVEQLGHPDYNQRQAAQKALEDLPRSALPIVVDHYHRTDDAEVRMRLRLYSRALFERYVLPRHPELHRPGFLGIGQTLIVINGEPRIVVAHVIPNSGADDAGLQQNDQIVALNGEPLQKDNPIQGLSESIKQHRPGQKITLTLYRTGTKMDITATLGELPDDQITDDLRRTMIDRRHAVEQYWFEHAFLKGRLEPVHETKRPQPTAE